MITVHIGLGKCASTTLQNSIFPQLSSINKNIEFNNEELNFLARRHHVIPLDNKKRDVFDKILKNGKDHIISSESLINWDPTQIENAADINLDLFGKEANIIIIVKDSLKYFTSVYQQIIHEGNIIPANSFFINSENHKKIKSFFLSKNKLVFFNAEDFSLKKIYDSYNDRFDNVFFVPLSKLNELKFIKDIYGFTDDEIKNLRNNLINNPAANVSYSSLAMNLTFKRERVLNLFGIKSYGSWDVSPLEQLHISSNKKKVPPFFSLKLKDKIKQLLVRIIKSFFWRSLMQGVVNKYLPYSKYKLPKGLPISKQQLTKDSIFLNKIEESYSEYRPKK